MKYSPLLCAPGSDQPADADIVGSGQEQEHRRPFQPEDMHRIRDRRQPHHRARWRMGGLHPYARPTRRLISRSTDLYMVSWDGQARLQLTHSKNSESRPRFSPDGKYLAFIRARRSGQRLGQVERPEDEEARCGVLNRSGG